MSNNSCTITEAGIEAASALRIVIYHVLTFIYLILGISTKLILLLAFYRQSKTEKAYAYQVVFTISKIFETFAFGTYLLAGKWFMPDQLDWFMTSYGLVQFFNLGQGLHVSFIISSLLLALTMSADRVFAILKPLEYRLVNHTVHKIVACTLCFLIAFLGAGMLFADAKIRVEGDRYVPYFDQILEHTVAGQVFFHFRLVCRVAGVILLIILNCLMIILFRKRIAKVASMTLDTKSIEGKARLAEKTLLWINIYQSCMTLANQLPHVIWQVLLFVLPPSFETCEGRYIGPICDGMLMVTDTTDFFVMMMLYKKMRLMVRRALCYCCPGNKE